MPLKLMRLILILMLLPAIPIISAQENIQLVITVPEWMGDSITNEVFDDFEAAHPGVEVVIVEGGMNSYVAPPGYGIDQYLTNLEANVTSADVFLANDISPVGTRAGYYLNLEPLVRADTTLNAEDFYPGVFESYQWDGGIWALPVTFDIQFLTYDPAKFDAAGLAYPSPDWDVEDFAIAAEALTVYDANGDVTMPGLISWNSHEMIRLLSGQGFYDTNFPADPYFTSPEVIATATRWQELTEAGFVGTTSTMGPDTEFGMAIGSAYNLQDFRGTTNKRGALLPGNYATMYVQGFAASAATQYPELAYELIKYLTNNPNVAFRTGNQPARQSIASAEVPEGMPIFRPEYEPEIQAFMDEAYAHVLPVSEVRYGDYLQTVLNTSFNPDGTPIPMEGDLPNRLQQLETQAKNDIQTATEKRNSTVLVVASPEALPELAPGEVGLNFGVFLNISPMPNRERWDAFLQEFAANDPQVGYVLLDPGFGGMEHPAEIYDCFYADNWYVRSNPGDNLISLDPFMAADPTFNTADFVPGALAGMQDTEGQTWGFPVLVSPRVLGYNTEMFDEAGVPYPQTGWTVSEFIETLRQLNASTGTTVMGIGDWGASYIYMLIAAFGGNPVDLMSEEISLSLTDPTNVEAIRQVLDLAKQGYLDYQQLASFSGGMGGNMPAIQTQFLGDIDWGFNAPEGEEFASPYRATTYPRGSTYTPVSYNLKGAFISKNTLAPEACYRLISALSQRPDLFSGMPARSSVIEQITEPRGDLFREYSTMLAEPNTLLISDQWVSNDAYIANFLIGRAFDQYVLEDADLLTSLEDAERKISEITTCIDSLALPELDQNAAPEEFEAQFQQQRDCALGVDPELIELFPDFE